MMNWAAPCAIAVQRQNAQLQVFNWSLSDNMDSVGLVVMPVFCYSTGKLALEESKVLTLLTKDTCFNLDTSFAVMFTDQVDARDTRPLMFPGKMVIPAPISPSKHPFYSCDLRKNRRTPDIKQLNTDSLKYVEDYG